MCENKNNNFISIPSDKYKSHTLFRQRQAKKGIELLMHLSFDN
jgi:hypothetical protein